MNHIKDQTTKEKIKQFFKGKIKVKEPLSRHTYIKIGGPVDWFFTPEDINDLRSLIKFLNKAKIDYRIIGKGSNLIVSDQAFEIATIELGSEYFRQIRSQQNKIYASAGASLSSLVNFAKQNSLSGCEFLTGIPGSVGGAVCMNAGVRNLGPDKNKPTCSISDIIESVEVIDKKGKLQTLKKDDIEFSYRSSSLKNSIIVGACFELIQRPQQLISEQIGKYLNNKMITQELSLPSAGCIFKNPDTGDLSAGALIDSAKLKGASIGDAAVSSIHANFIVNQGNASFEQVMSLIRQVQQTVKMQSKISLEPEVEIWQPKER